MNRLHLDTSALIALADPGGAVLIAVHRSCVAGILPEASAIAWHEFVRGPLTSDELLRVERVLDGRVTPVRRSTAELAARLFNATGRRRASTADCLIAAGAIEAGAGLLTLNTADFELFRPFGLQLAGEAGAHE